MNDGRKKKPQKHMNRTAFKITFDTQALQKQKKVSMTNLCIRCTQQLEWKLQYNKYKKMTEPARCNFCEEKNVFRTYMKACQSCVQTKNVCAKCLTPDYQQPQEVKVRQKDQKKQQKVQYNQQIDFMKTLQQRSRRTVRRWLEKKKITWSNEQEYFIDEEGNKMIGLHFKKGFGHDEEGDNENSEDIMDEDGEISDDDAELQDDQDEDQKEKDDRKSNHKNKKSQNDKVKNQGQDKEKQQDDKAVQKANESIGDNKNDQQGNSDVEGDEVDCENDLNSENDNDNDIDSDEEEQESEQQAQKKNIQANKNKTSSK